MTDSLADLDRRLAEDRRLDPYRCAHCQGFHGPGACPVVVAEGQARGHEWGTRPDQPERNAEIKRRALAGESQRALAREFDLSRTRVWQIVNGNKR